MNNGTKWLRTIVTCLANVSLFVGSATCRGDDSSVSVDQVWSVERTDGERLLLLFPPGQRLAKVVPDQVQSAVDGTEPTDPTSALRLPQVTQNHQRLLHAWLEPAPLANTYVYVTHLDADHVHLRLWADRRPERQFEINSRTMQARLVGGEWVAPSPPSETANETASTEPVRRGWTWKLPTWEGVTIHFHCYQDQQTARVILTVEAPDAVRKYQAGRLSLAPPKVKGTYDASNLPLGPPQPQLEVDPEVFRGLPSAIPADTNGAVTLWRHAGWTWLEPELLQPYQRALGVPPDDSDSTYVTLTDHVATLAHEDATEDEDAPADDLTDDDLEQLRLDATSSRWKSSDLPEISSWLRHNAAELDRLSAACQSYHHFWTPRFYSAELSALAGVRMPHLHALQELGDALTARNLRADASPSADSVLRDVRCLKVFADWLSQGWTVAELIGSMELHRQALLVTAAYLHDHPTDGGAWPAQRSPAGTAAELADAADILLRCERPLGLDAVAFISQRGCWGLYQMMEVLQGAGAEPDTLAILPRAWHPHPPQYWLRVMQEMDQHYQDLAARLRIQDLNTQQRQLDAWDQLVKQRTERFTTWLRSPEGRSTAFGILPSDSERMSTACFIMFMPSFRSLQQVAAAPTISDDLEQLVIALARYRADHHEYPESLTRLTPDYLPRCPVDPHDHQPYGYTRTEVGYELYSRWPLATTGEEVHEAAQQQLGAPSSAPLVDPDQLLFFVEVPLPTYTPE